MRDTMYVDAANMDDLDRVADQWTALAREQHEHGSHLDAESNREAIRASLAGHVMDGTLFVAREDDRIVGFVSFEVESGSLDMDVTRGHIQNLYVEPDERNRGVGSALLDRAESKLADADVDVVAIEAMAANEAVRRLYRRRGYDPHRVVFEKRVSGESDRHSRTDG